MRKDIRKTIDVPLFGDSVPVDVTFKIIEIVERVYGQTADLVASTLLTDPRQTLRHKVADVIVAWVGNRESLGEYSRTELRGEIMTAPVDVFRVYVGAIQAAVLYSLRYVTEQQFDQLSRGEDLTDDAAGEAAEPVGKPKRKPSSRRVTS